MTPKLFKAAEVCDMTQVPAYVLRSWEKEFPAIGVQKSVESARLYRQSDVDQVLRIKQLVFAEGLTLAGARRRLEELEPPSPVSEEEVAEVIEALGSNARIRLVTVRQGLESILKLLSDRPRPNGQAGGVGPIGVIEQRVRGSKGSKAAARASLHARPGATKRSTEKVRTISAGAKTSPAANAKARLKTATKARAGTKRKRANA